MKNITYKIRMGFLMFILMPYLVFSQECFDFENSGSINNWKGNSGFGIANLSVITSPGTNTTSHLYFEDRSGGSVAINEVDFNGNWIEKADEGCLCFDYRVNWNSSTPTTKKGPNFIIYRLNTGQSISNINSVADWINFASNGNYAGLYAIFVPNPSNPSIPKNQWNKYCLPIIINGNSLPSNTYGTWQIRQTIPGSGSTPNSVVTLSGVSALTAWNSLITAVGGVCLDADYHGTPNEQISFDNFCWNCEGNPSPQPNPQLCCNIPNLAVKLINKTNLGGGIFLNISGISTPIQNIEVSMTDYHVVYDSLACKPANMGIFGNISSPNNTVGGLALADNGTQSISWNPGSPGVFNGNIKLNISKPNILNLPCCNGKMYFCLKVKITDVNCNVCEKLVCGEINLIDHQLQQGDPKDVPVDLTPTDTISNPHQGGGTVILPNIGDLHFNEVANPKTGKIWMDRNLGASQVATSPTDSQAYGDLYQWGRLTDGHEKRTSGTTTILSASDMPGHNKFIAVPSSEDWRVTFNNNLWQGVNGINNPCPSGYRLPTAAELNAERLSWTTNDAAGAFASPLKWIMAGARATNGTLAYINSRAFYLSSNIESTNHVTANGLQFTTTNAYIYPYIARNVGSSVRCIKN